MNKHTLPLTPITEGGAALLEKEWTICTLFFIISYYHCFYIGLCMNNPKISSPSLSLSNLVPHSLCIVPSVFLCFSILNFLLSILDLISTHFTYTHYTSSLFMWYLNQHLYSWPQSYSIHEIFFPTEIEYFYQSILSASLKWICPHLTVKLDHPSCSFL